MSSILPLILPYHDLGSNVIVTKEEFNLFHIVDRRLFSRLVVGLGREVSESINAMAFFMWVESKSKQFNLVANILQHWPDVMLSGLVDEVVVILNCIESSRYPNSFLRESKLLLIQQIMRCKVTFEFFHEKRLELIADVTKFINNVCIRAFTDIIQQVYYERVVKEQELHLRNVYGGSNIPIMIQPQGVYYAPNDVSMVRQQFVVPQFNEFAVGVEIGHAKPDVFFFK